jgi:hypothetical protein
MALCVSPTSFRAVSTSILDSKCKNSQGELGRPNFFRKREQQVGFFGGMAFCVSPTALFLWRNGILRLTDGFQSCFIKILLAE